MQPGMYIVLLEASLGIAKRSHYASPAWNKISATFYTFGKLSLNATLQLPSLNVATETKLLPLYKSAHILAVLPGCLS